MHTFYIAPTSSGCGLTSVTLGLVRALDNVGLKVKFFKPIAQQHRSDSGPERSTLMIGRTMNQEPPKPIPLTRVEDMLGNNKRDELMEEIVAEFSKVAQDAEVVVVEGLVPTRETPYFTRLNAEIVRSLSAEVILVTTLLEDGLDSVGERLEIAAANYGGLNNPRVLGYILNKVPRGVYEQLNVGGQMSRIPELSRKPLEPIGYLPWDPALSSPRTRDIHDYLGTKLIHAGKHDYRRVKNTVLCARTAANITEFLSPGTLVITPGDRDDIIMASSLAAANGVPLAGLLLTNGVEPDPNIYALCKNAIQSSGLPILSTSSNSYTTATRLDRMNNEVPIDDRERIELVMNRVAERLNAEWLKERCGVQKTQRLSPPAFRYQLVKRAQDAKKRIVLPEGNEPRTIRAAAICQERGIAQCILLGKREEIVQVAEGQGLKLPEGLVILDPDEVRERYVGPMVELRKHKGLNAPMATAQLEDTVVLGTMMLALNEVDGLVSGAVHTTANTIRPAFQLIKTKPDAKLVSSVFFMLLPDQVLVYGDCAVNPDPGAEELADIAIQSADSAKAFGIEPKVAMISYSTGSSGQGSDVEKVRRAAEIAKEKRPDLLIDGPLQYDAASVESVARSKAPNSEVAGQATVFVFPDLNTGNTTYKAVQRSADVISVGPMLQGLRKPVNDLSRGALVDDIVFTIALTAIQADAEAKAKANNA